MSKRTAMTCARPLRDLKRGLILDAARAVFEADGLDGASLRSIAAAAGYTPAALYFHFESKEADLCRGPARFTCQPRPGHRRCDLAGEDPSRSPPQSGHGVLQFLRRQSAMTSISAFTSSAEE